ncbi:MAG: hypothetical protein LUG55_11530 [Clostridiales bacterium]|nr:hypothetical protein [Clostridiales bacterium]
MLAGLLTIWAVGSYATHSTTIGMVYGCVNLAAWPLISWLLGREMRCVERTKDALTKTIWGLLGLYVVQKLLIFWLKIIIGKSASLNFLNDDNTAWLYLCGAAWLALALLIERRGWKHGPVLAVSVALGCVAGYLPVVEEYLCLNKLFVFAPLFLVGFWGRPERLEEFLNRVWVRVLSLVALLAVAGGCLVASGPLYNNVGFLTAADAYASLGNTWLNTFGGLFRLAWYGVIAVMGAALLSVMPRKKLPLLTLCGKRWFSVYFWLRPVTYFLRGRRVPGGLWASVQQCGLPDRRRRLRLPGQHLAEYLRRAVPPGLVRRHRRDGGRSAERHAPEEAAPADPLRQAVVQRVLLAAAGDVLPHHPGGECADGIRPPGENRRGAHLPGAAAYVEPA